MKVFVKGQGEISLTQRHYVATGGQASVYVKDGVAYKIYTNPADTIPDAKMRALGAISDSAIIKPDKIILDEKKTTPIGYTMAAIPDNYSLCQLFTRAFRDRNHVTHDNIINLSARLRTHISHVHAASILIVDLNELNILVSRTFDETYFIDVDSYQAPGYPATVIMPSVRDYSVKAQDFSPLSDWFSYGILTFQMFIGVHPYKGTHPPSAAIPKDHRMVHRMERHISAFSPEVSLPGCCYPFDVIPAHFRDWLKAVLQEGKRLPPPDPKSVQIIAIAAGPPSLHAAATVTSGNIIIKEIMDLEGWSLVSYAESGGSSAALITRGSLMRTLVNGHTVAETSTPAPGSLARVGFTPWMNQPITLTLLPGGLISFKDHARKTEEHLPFTASQMAKSGERFHVKNGTSILEMEFSELPAKTIVTASHTVGNVMERASHLYEGVAIQNMLGSIFVSLFPKSRCGYQVRIEALDGYNIIDAKFEVGVLMVVGARAGHYDRLVFRFDTEYQTFDTRVVTDISPNGLNFVTLDSGVCVCLNEEEEIEAFSARKDSKGMKVVKDEAIGGDVRLLHVGGKVGFERGGKIYQMSLK